jgi:hypothetical protein
MGQSPPREPLVIVSVFLFGKPAWEIDGLEGSPVGLELLDAIESCGKDLGTRLVRAAELGRRLVGSGWEGYGLLYAVEFYKTTTLRGAQEELGSLGIGPDEVSLRAEDEGSGC